MVQIIKLNEEDLKEIIAKYYNVQPDHVRLESGTRRMGYGMNEYDGKYIDATIILSSKGE